MTDGSQNWQPQPIAQQTQQINDFNNLAEAQKRAAKIQQEAYNAEAINRLRWQLNSILLSPLRQAVGVQCPLPLEKLPEQAGRLVRAFSATHGVETDMATVCLFAAMFTAARGSFRVRVDIDYTEVLTAYIVASAPSGDRKSAVVDFFRRPFVAFQDEQQAAFCKRTQALDRMALEGALKKAEANLHKKLSRKITSSRSLEQATMALQPELEAANTLRDALKNARSLPRLFMDMPTPEALATEMQLQGEAMAIWEAEGGLWKHRLHPSQDDIFLKSFTGESFASDTKTLGRVYLQAPVLAVCTLVQPNVMEALYGNAEAVGHGLVPRILPLLSGKKLGYQFSFFPPEKLEEIGNWYREHIWALLGIERPESPNGNRTFHELELTAEAHAEFIRFQEWCSHHFLNLSPDTGEGYRAFLSKLPGHAVRVAGATHLMKHVDPQCHLIDRASMESGTAFAEFFRRHAVAAFDPNVRHAVKYARKVLDWIKRDNPTHFTERDAQRKVNSHGTVEQVRAGLAELEQRGFLRRHIPIWGGGAVWVVHPGAYCFWG